MQALGAGHENTVIGLSGGFCGQFTDEQIKNACCQFAISRRDWLLCRLLQCSMYLGLLKMTQFKTDIPQSPSNHIILGFSTWLFLDTVARNKHANRHTDTHKLFYRVTN